MVELQLADLVSCSQLVVLCCVFSDNPPATLLTPAVLVVAGQTLKMLVHMSQAKRVLEIGMFTGYGALSMAEGLPEDGCLVACELEPYLKDFSRPLFDKSPHGSKISVRTGSAMDTLQVGPEQSLVRSQTAAVSL